MVYIEINGVRLDQPVLLGIAEAVIACVLYLSILITLYFPCVRPRDTRFRWLRAWRVHATIYVALAILAEFLWVQLGQFTDTDANAIGCHWSQSRLAAWAIVQTGCLVRILSSWTYCHRKPVAATVNGLIGAHATAMMAFGMLGMFQSGACASALFPMLASAFGMVGSCCCIPWYSGAWDTDMLEYMDKDGISDGDFVIDEEMAEAIHEANQERKAKQRLSLTVWGRFCAHRHRKKRKRQQQQQENKVNPLGTEAAAAADQSAPARGGIIMNEPDSDSDSDVSDISDIEEIPLDMNGHISTDSSLDALMSDGDSELVPLSHNASGDAENTALAERKAMLMDSLVDDPSTWPPSLDDTLETLEEMSLGQDEKKGIVKE